MGNPEDDAMEQAREAIYRQMAESIRLAHEINPNSWLVMYWQKEILVLVGAYWFCSLRRDMTGRAGLMLQAPLPDLGDIEVDETPFKLHREFCRVRIPVREMTTWFLTLREPHHRAIATAAKRKPNYWKEYDERAVMEIEEITGETLPRPAYLDDPRFNEGVLDDVPWIVASRLASTIALAHRTNDRSWSFYRSQRSVVVTVADLPVAKWKQRPGRIELCVWLDDVPDRVLRRWEEQRGDDAILDGQAEWFWARGYEIYDFIEDFAEAHERLVESIAHGVRTRAKAARKFDGDLLNTLSGHARESLDRPAYARGFELVLSGRDMD